MTVIADKGMVQSVTITARHALITSAIIGLDPKSDTTSYDEKRQTQTTLDALALAMIGKRYESLEDVKETGGPWSDNAASAALADEVLDWLRRAM
jgi:lipoate-protein ligase A